MLARATWYDCKLYFLICLLSFPNPSEGLQEEGAHFGGFEDEDQKDQEEEEGGEERKKTKAEVMKEVMAKSKLAKYERQQTRMADDDIREELDNELGDIRSLLFEIPKEEAVEEPTADKRPLFGDGKRKDAYDSAVREMAFERRAKPQDRLKTEAEKAEELAEKLKKAEGDRIKRMRGEDLSDEENGRKGKKGRVGGGDDLEDDFELDGMTSRDVYGLGRGLATEQDEDNVEEEGQSQDEGEEEDDSVEHDEKSDSEAAEEEDDFGDLADMDGVAQTGEDEELEDGSSEEELDLTATSKKRKSRRLLKDQQRKVLPFTFPCPTTHDEFLDILEANEVDVSQIVIVIKRIRALYHPSLAEINKFKLQAFLGVLLDHIVYTTTQLSSQKDNSTSIQLIDAVISQIFSLSKLYTSTSAEHFINKLALMQRNLIRGLNKGPLLGDSKTWPGVTECILLKITSSIWPTSDRIHAVATPLTILIGQYLSSCRVRNVKDLASGLFLCCLSYNCERQSKRLVPEALNFLHNAVTLLAPVKSIKVLRRINQAYGIPWPDVGIEGLKDLQITNLQATPQDKVDFISVFSGKETNLDESKASILMASFSLISDFATLYTGSPAFVELFEPFNAICDNLGTLHTVLEERRIALQATLIHKIKNAKSERRFLRLQTHRAIAIASHVPKFDQGFNPERRGGRTFDPDTERAEQSKLRSLLKKERKGAIRELRRDNEFLANEKRKEREEEDQRYKKTIDRIVGSLAEERGEQKKYLREKDRLKKRSGKK